MGLNWDNGKLLPMVGSDLWQLSLSFDDSFWNTTLEVKCLVDDKDWMIGSNAKFLIEKSKSTHYVADVYPWFYTNTGTLQVIDNVFSPELNNTRSIIVYLPPSFYENTHKVISNVLVMHDGQNLFDPKTAFMGNAWMCQDTVNELVVEGKMDEIVIVGVYNTPQRVDELTYSKDKQYGGGKGDLYLKFLESQVLPLIAKRYQNRVDVADIRSYVLLDSTLKF
jgi:hypothetical protein